MSRPPGMSSATADGPTGLVLLNRSARQERAEEPASLCPGEQPGGWEEQGRLAQEEGVGGHVLHNLHHRVLQLQPDVFSTPNTFSTSTTFSTVTSFSTTSTTFSTSITFSTCSHLHLVLHPLLPRLLPPCLHLPPRNVKTFKIRFN